MLAAAHDKFHRSDARSQPPDALFQPQAALFHRVSRTLFATSRTLFDTCSQPLMISFIGQPTPRFQPHAAHPQFSWRLKDRPGSFTLPGLCTSILKSQQQKRNAPEHQPTHGRKRALSPTSRAFFYKLKDQPMSKTLPGLYTYVPKS